jgi:ribonucleotide reductase beta subunit family protein with ferritin-like domain
MEEELLLIPENRLVLYPIIRHDIWKHYKSQLASFWTAEELDFSQDVKDWDTLTTDEQHFIKYVLAFFAGSDTIVMENLIQRFTGEVSWLEVKFNYGFQAMMEAIHSEVYSLMIDTFIKDQDEKSLLFNSITTIPSIQKKQNWAIKWLDDTYSSFATRLIAFACVEGIFFSGSFCAIYWLKQRGLMPGLTISNEFISRDEGLHTDFACLLYSKIVHRVKKEKVYEILKEAVDIEKEFICESLPCRLLGMNQELMSNYIEYVADRLLTQLGYEKMYHTSNPFDFMERISLEGKSNFFERRISDYSKAGVGVDKKEMTFGTDGEF